MKKAFATSLISLTFLSLAALVIASPVFAQNSYGGGTYGTTTTPADLTVNKKVRTPLPPFEFRENLSETDISYKPETDVIFQISITNSGSETFEEVNVRDTLSNNVVSASVASEFNAQFSKPILFFTIKDLKPGETRVIEVTAKLAKETELTPSNRSLICEANEVHVSSEGRSDDDKANYCIKKEVLGVTTLPKAGPEDYLPIVPFALMGILGLKMIFRPNKKQEFA